MRQFIHSTLSARSFRICLAVGLALISVSALAQFPENVEIDSKCDNRVSIMWDDSMDAHGYLVTVHTHTYQKVVCDSPDNSCLIKGLMSGKSYDLFVDRKTDGGVELSSQVFQFKGPRTEDCPEYVAATPTPRPSVDTCSRLPSGISVSGHRPFSTHCQQVDEGSVGNDELIAQGILDAVDVWGDVSAEVQVCFHQQGYLKFLDAATSPRAQSDLPAERMNGTTCGWINRAGTVALVARRPLAPPSQQCDIATTGNLKLRATPSMAGAVIDYVPRGAALKPIEWNGHWVNVEYQGEAGWVSARYVSENGDCGAPVAPQPAASPAKQCQIFTTGNLKLRAASSMASAVIDYVPRGAALKPIEWNAHWVNVEYQGEAGWVGARYVSENGDCS